MSERTSTKKDAVTGEAEKVLLDKPEGMRWRELQEKLHEKGFKWNSLFAQIPDLPKKYPDVFYKPERGLYRLVKFREEDDVPQNETPQLTKQRLQESDFYEPFADYLVGELEECTNAIPLGGNKFGGKWGTPDVIGILKKRGTDLIDFPIEIISAEIKLNPSELITAFGQACAYRLFSHKSYLVIPKTAASADIARLVSLCVGSGIGLITFDPNNKDNPDFSIHAHAIKSSPDMFYLNENIRHVANDLL